MKDLLHNESDKIYSRTIFEEKYLPVLISTNAVGFFKIGEKYCQEKLDLTRIHPEFQRFVKKMIKEVMNGEKVADEIGYIFENPERLYNFDIIKFIDSIKSQSSNDLTSQVEFALNELKAPWEDIRTSFEKYQEIFLTNKILF